MTSLVNNVAVITGAGSGIGKATALSFSSKGAHVVLAGRRRDKLEAVAGTILSEGGKCLVIQTDVSSEADVQNLMNRTVETYGHINTLVNCAGRGLKSEIIDISLDEWQSVLQTNLTGVFLCSREAIRIMMKQADRGHIITVSSISAIYGTAGYAAYCASKHGVTGFGRSLKWEMHKYRIKGSTVHPGRTNTEFFDTYPKRPGEKEMLPAADVADVIVAVAEQARFRRSILVCRNLLKRATHLIGATA